MKSSVECGMRNAEFRIERRKEPGLTSHSELRTPNSHGFTILEVMIAVALLGLVIVSLLGLRNRSVQDVLLAERITVATMLAERVMTETLIAPALLPLELEGAFEEEDEFRDFTWKKIVALTPVPGVMEVRVAVLWREGEREEKVELVSYE